MNAPVSLCGEFIAVLSYWGQSRHFEECIYRLAQDAAQRTGVLADWHVAGNIAYIDWDLYDFIESQMGRSGP